MQNFFADTILRRLVSGWRSLVQREERLTELEGCDPHEIERMAEDLGLSVSELRSAAARDGQTIMLMRRRMRTLGIEPGKIDAATMRDMERTCTSCENETECEHDLDTDPQRANWPRYCPNSATLIALAAKRGH